MTFPKGFELGHAVLADTVPLPDPQNSKMHKKIRKQQLKKQRQNSILALQEKVTSYSRTLGCLMPI